MSPQIVQVGVKKEQEKYPLRCNSCNTIAIFEHSEGRDVSDRDGNAMVFTCPVCKKELWYNKEILNRGSW